MLYISTNMLDEENFRRIYDFVGEDVGIEIFPLWDNPFYEWSLVKESNILKNIPTTFHGPYYGIEHSAKKGSSLYEYSMKQLMKTIRIAEELGSKYLVFHHNNSPIENKEKMLYYARENLFEIMELSKQHNIPIVVENAGIRTNNNMLLDENDFIKECRRIPNRVLIDIGHCNCNGWKLERVIKELADKICAYHIHNNDGKCDLHKRIYHGTLNFNAFLELAAKYTPHADMTLEYARTEANDKVGIIEDIKIIKKFIS